MNIETKVKNTIQKYKLCNKKEKILVALSGGKDSSVVAYLLKKSGYSIEGIYIDLRIGKYSDRCLESVKKLCKDLDVKLHIYDIKKEQKKTMKEIWKKTKKMRLNNCVVCGIFKKWILNREARKLKAEKIATGHNLDDETQTFLMNIFKASPELSSKSGPITRNIQNKKFIPRIKPLFYIPEEDIKKYAKQKELAFVKGKCPYAQDSYRIQVRKFVNTLSDKEKENVIKNFEIISKKIQKMKDIKIRYCEICGEPSRNKICKKCELMNIK